MTTISTPSPSNKKPLLIGLAVVLLFIVVGGVLLWYTSPKRTLNAFLQAIENKDQEAAMKLVSDQTEPNKQENVQWFVEDWVIAESVKTAVEKDESWRSRVVMVDENGQQVAKMNKYGFEEKEQKPTPKYIAHHYQAFGTVTFSDGEEEFEDPVIIKLKRATDDTWSTFGQLFRGWKVTNIKYQPFDEEDFENIEFGEDDFVDLEGGDAENVEFELDEEGNLVEPTTDDAEENTDEEEVSEEESEETVETEDEESTEEETTEETE